MFRDNPRNRGTLLTNRSPAANWARPKGQARGDLDLLLGTLQARGGPLLS